MSYGAKHPVVAKDPADANWQEIFLSVLFRDDIEVGIGHSQPHAAKAVGSLTPSKGTMTFINAFRMAMGKEMITAGNQKSL